MVDGSGLAGNRGSLRRGGVNVNTPESESVVIPEFAKVGPPQVPSLPSELITESTRDWCCPGKSATPWQDEKWSRKQTWQDFKPLTDPVFTSLGFLRERQWVWENKALSKENKDRISGFPRIGRNIMAPGNTELAVKRWVSTVEGEITVVVDMQCLEASKNGQMVFFLHNGVKVHLDSLHTADPKKKDFRTRWQVLTVNRGDCLDFVVDSRGGLIGDWTYVNVSITKGRSVFEEASVHFAFDENSDLSNRPRLLKWIEQIGFPEKAPGKGAFLC